MLYDERLRQLRLQMNAVRRALAEFETQAELVRERFGLQSPQQNKQDVVVDVGARVGVVGVVASLAKRTVQGVLLATSFALLGFAMLALGMFAGAAALAFLLITRGLGLRVDLPSRPAAPAT